MNRHSPLFIIINFQKMQTELKFYQSALEELQKMKSDIQEATLMFSEQYTGEFEAYGLQDYKEFMVEEIYNEGVHSIDNIIMEIQHRIEKLKTPKATLLKAHINSMGTALINKQEVRNALSKNLLIELKESNSNQQIQSLWQPQGN